jgi:hypothetical protein
MRGAAGRLDLPAYRSFMRDNHFKLSRLAHDRAAKARLDPAEGTGADLAIFLIHAAGDDDGGTRALALDRVQCREHDRKRRLGVAGAASVQLVSVIDGFERIARPARRRHRVQMRDEQ